MDANTVLIPASDVQAIGQTILTNVSTIAPAVLGIMGIGIVVGLVFKLVKKAKSGL